MYPIRIDRRIPTFTRITHINNTNFFCCVKGCKNTQRNTKISFYSLPRERDRRIKWLRAIGRKDLLRKTKLNAYKVCSTHFTRSVTANWCAYLLKPGAVPSEYLPQPAQPTYVTYDEDIAEAGSQTVLSYGNDPVTPESDESDDSPDERFVLRSEMVHECECCAVRDPAEQQEQKNKKRRE